ncbi:hypothetical protein SH668x_001181 [Planctomicrobium sp. SH668]|uniref:hypothetical protein n=1 Tax=Planctomicrobium sp. SH668 TaxID=3448126 RepID=UPI003F5BD4A6
MLRIRPYLTSCVFAGGLLGIFSQPAFSQSAETEGIVRVSDRAFDPESTPGVSVCPECQTECGNNTGRQCCLRRGTGYVFSPPVKRPIYRTPVSYQKGFPDSWTGQGQPVGGPVYQARTVYMPTDTTQLGYYYQTVPYWQPRPGAIPPPPVPSQWHTRMDQMQTYGRHPAGKIFGTAPTAIPADSYSALWDSNGVPPEPTRVLNPSVDPNVPADPVAPPIQSAPVSEPSGTALEKSASQPQLFPIN